MKRSQFIGIFIFLFSCTSFAANIAKRDMVCSIKSSTIDVKLLYSKNTDSTFTQTYKIFDNNQSGFDVSFIRQTNISTNQMDDHVAVTIVPTQGIGIVPSQIINGKQVQTTKGAPIIIYLDSNLKSMLKASASFTVVKNESLFSDVSIKCNLLDEGVSAGIATGELPKVVSPLGPQKITQDSSKVDSSNTIAPKARSAMDIVKSFNSKVSTAK